MRTAGKVSTGAMTYAFIQALTENPNATYDQILSRMRSILIEVLSSSRLSLVVSAEKKKNGIPLCVV
jgi:hypothetical protein